MNLALKQSFSDRLLAPLKEKLFPSMEEELLLRLVVSCTGEVPVKKLRDFITGSYEDIWKRILSAYKDSELQLLEDFKGFRYAKRLKAIIDLRRRLDLIEKISDEKE